MAIWKRMADDIATLQHMQASRGNNIFTIFHKLHGGEFITPQQGRYTKDLQGMRK